MCYSRSGDFYAQISSNRSPREASAKELVGLSLFEATPRPPPVGATHDSTHAPRPERRISLATDHKHR
jgi:hypothetical protein